VIGGGSCRFNPVSRGFQSGVDLLCDYGAAARRLRAEDDFGRGRLRVFVNDRLAEQHCYNRDTFELKARRAGELSHQGR
jgi:hypothetical protein